MSKPNFGKLARFPDMASLMAASVDDVLVRQFLTDRDDAAFRELVCRYGRLVSGVCNRVLRDAHDAEDAFQATFLVFAVKASRLRAGEPIGPWLQTVATRVALRLRAKRHLVQQRAWRVDPTVSEESPTVDEGVEGVIDEEVARLPQEYREVISLHFLEGRTVADVARETGRTEGQVRGAIYRGKALLKSRLERRGLAVGVAVIAAVLVPGASPADSLVGTTVAVGMKAQAVGLAGSGASAVIIGHAEGVLRAMGLMRAAWVAATVCLAILTGGFALSSRPSPAPAKAEVSLAPRPKKIPAVPVVRSDPAPIAGQYSSKIVGLTLYTKSKVAVVSSRRDDPLPQIYRNVAWELHVNGSVTFYSTTSPLDRGGFMAGQVVFVDR